MTIGGMKPFCMEIYYKVLFDVITSQSNEILKNHRAILHRISEQCPKHWCWEYVLKDPVKLEKKLEELFYLEFLNFV